MKIVYFLALLLVLSNAQVPAFKTVVSQNGFNYLHGVGINLLEKFLTNLSIPFLSGSTGIIQYNLTNILLDSVSIQGTNAQIIPNEGFTLTLSNIAAYLNLEWHYQETLWPYLHDQGTADINATLSSSVSLQITEINGKPVLYVLGDSIQISDLQVQLNGGASWFYEIFVKLLTPLLEQAISSQLQSTISQDIGLGLNFVLEALPLNELLLGKEIELSFKLLSNPVFADTYMEWPQSGEFYQSSNPQECPAAVCPSFSSPNTVDSEMLQFILTDFMANSAGFTFFNLGALKLNLTDSDIPSWSPVRLNTASFKYILPALFNEYPNAPMELNLYNTQPPFTVFTPDGAVVTAIGNMDVDVVVSGQLIPVFTLSGSITSSGTAYLSGLTLAGNLTYVQGNFTVENSNIGPFAVSVLNNLLNTLFSVGVVPTANTILKKGFTLPAIPGLTFVNPTLGFDNRFLYISTDIQYTPNTLPESNSINVNDISQRRIGIKVN